MRRTAHYRGCSTVVSIFLALLFLTGPSASPISALIQGSTLWTALIPPQDVDPTASPLLAPHYVAFDASAPRRGELFVFLGSYLATPPDTTLIVQQAAQSGFHAIGLSYPKPSRLDTVCGASLDEKCFEEARQSVIAGSSATSPVMVGRGDSIINQLNGLLSYLAGRDPAAGWQAYLGEGMPLWSAIRLAGHSEGGGHTALIARDHTLARLCLLEAPVDLIGPAVGVGHLPSWVEAGGATSADRIYGFRHVHTGTPYVAAIQGAWGLLGLNDFGASVDVDTSQPPYNASHHLTTDAVPAVMEGTPNIVHRSLVEDRLTPKTVSGEPLFAPVWQYACLS